VVYDMATQQAHGFFIGHQSQGLAHHDMTLSVRDMPQPPPEQVKGLPEIARIHQIMSEISRDLQQNIDFKALLYSNKLAIPDRQFMNSADTECADSPEMLVMRAAMSAHARTWIQIRAQDKYDANVRNRIIVAQFSLSSLGFSARLNSTMFDMEFEGTFQFTEQNKNNAVDYAINAKLPGLNHSNQVVYDLSVKNNGVLVETDFEKTILSKVSLAEIMRSRGGTDKVKAETLTKCAAEAIDQEFPKIITPEGRPPAYGNANHGGAIVWPGFGQMPLSRRGGGGGSYQTCDHHYYDRQGNHLFTIGGPCP
jgi:hypothetical protein